MCGVTDHSHIGLVCPVEAVNGHVVKLPCPPIAFAVLDCFSDFGRERSKVFVLEKKPFVRFEICKVNLRSRREFFVGFNDEFQPICAR